MSATGTQADRVGGAVDLAHRRLLAAGHLGLEDEVDRVEVLLPPVRGGAGEVQVVDAEQRSDGHGDPGLLVDLAHERCLRRLAVVDPATGQRPATGLHGVRGQPREQDAVVATDQRLGRQPLPLDRQVRPSASRHQRHHGQPAAERRRRAGASGRRPSSRRSRRPAVRGRRRPPSRRTRSARRAAPSAAARGHDRSRRVDPRLVTDLRVADRSPRRPRGPPRRAGARRTRCHRRAGSSARSARGRARAATAAPAVAHDHGVRRDPLASRARTGRHGAESTQRPGRARAASIRH